MKKVLFVLLAIFLFAVPVMAQDEEKEAFIFPDFSSLNGDILYLWEDEAWATGIGTPIVSWREVAYISGQYVYVISDEQDARSMVGLSLDINLVQLANLVKAEWKLPDIGATLGITGVIDVADEPTIKPAIKLSLIRYKF